MDPVRPVGVAEPPTSPPAPPATPTTRTEASALWPTLALAIVCLAGGAVLHQVGSWIAYAQVLPTSTAVEAELHAAVDDEHLDRDRADAAIDRAERLQGALTGELADADASAELTASTAALTALLDRPSPVAPITGTYPGAGPAVPAWDRYAAIVDLAAEIPRLHDRAAEFAASGAALRDAGAAVAGAADAAVDAAVGRAETVLSETPLASTRTRLDLQYAVDVTADAGDAAALTALADAVAAVRAGQAAEEAHRRDEPLRADIEAFARSLSNGVALDFTWAYEAAGVPSDGWYAGTAEFWPESGGWGLITLTFSVADNWDDENARAVVVHEVGHTQVIRDACRAQFTGPVFAGDHEQWATAWAIGMGYDLPGSGIEAYGRPSDEQIAVAATCR